MKWHSAKLLPPEGETVRALVGGKIPVLAWVNSGGRWCCQQGLFGRLDVGVTHWAEIVLPRKGKP